MKIIVCILIFFLVLFPLRITAQSDSMLTTLNQCISAALSNNPGIKEYSNEVTISELGIKTAKSGLYPAVTSEVAGGLSEKYHYENDYQTGNASITANQVLWQNGRIKSLVVQANYNKTASEFSLESRKNEIILAVKTVYLNCQLQIKLYNISLENVSKALLFLEYAQERYNLGIGKKSDILKAESDLSEARYESDIYLNSIKKLENELVMLTGLSAERLSKLEDDWQHETSGVLTRHADSLLSIALQNYPDLQVTNNLILSQEARIQQVNAELFPQLSFKGGYEWSYDPITNEQKGWYSVLTLRWDLFNGNERHNRLETEKIRKSVYENQQDEMQDFLVKEINNRLISIKEADSQVQLTNSLMKTTSENLEIAEAEYIAGTRSMLELTDARSNDLNAKQKNVQAIASYRLAMANLEQLTGNIDEYNNQ